MLWSVKILHRFRAKHSCPHHKIKKNVLCAVVPWVLWPTLFSIYVPFPSWTQAAEGARWMSEKEEELAKVEAKLASLSKRAGVSKGLEFKQMEIDPLVELGYG